MPFPALGPKVCLVLGPVRGQRSEFSPGWLSFHVALGSLLRRPWAGVGNTAQGAFFFFLFRAAPTAYGSFQAGGQIRVTATGLCHSHSNSGTEPRLQPTPQLTEMPDP